MIPYFARHRGFRKEEMQDAHIHMHGGGETFGQHLFSHDLLGGYSIFLLVTGRPFRLGEE